MSEEHKETPLAYAAFLEYCALGRGRSLRKLAEIRGQSEGKVHARLATIEDWSSKHKWQERVRQYDAEIIAERVARKQAKREEMEDRHVDQTREEQDAARRYILARIAPETNEAKPSDESLIASLFTEKINLGSVVQLLKNSREDERKALVEEDVPKFEPVGPVIGVAIYLPQKQTMPGPGGTDVNSES